MTFRRRALWALLVAKLIGGWGVGWDIRWHLIIGRDSFWIAPHVMTYASVVVASLISLGVLLFETWRSRSGPRPPGTVTIAWLRGTRGFHLAWWGMAIVILAAPIDDLWHRLFGLDVTLWSPPLALAVGALLVQISILLVGDLGFAILEPVSAIEEAIAADPTSPVAIAHEMARRNGWVPGRSMVLRLIPLAPAALMTLADPLRRWRLASGVFGLALVVVSAAVLGRFPMPLHDRIPTSREPKQRRDA